VAVATTYNGATAPISCVLKETGSGHRIMMLAHASIRDAVSD